MDIKIEIDRGNVSPRAREEHRNTPRQWAYLILEEGQTEGGISRFVEMLLIALIVSNTIAVILETVPELYNNYRAFFSTFEQVTVYIFAVEYFFRLWSCVEDPRVGTRYPVRGRLPICTAAHDAGRPASFAPYFIALGFGAAGRFACSARFASSSPAQDCTLFAGDAGASRCALRRAPARYSAHLSS
ncbi:MAG: hypothetical protein WDM89_10670 [Rhizomicrobium sp.]